MLVLVIIVCHIAVVRLSHLSHFVLVVLVLVFVVVLVLVIIVVVLVLVILVISTSANAAVDLRTARFAHGIDIRALKQ